MSLPSEQLSHLPSRIDGLVGIAANLAWSWDREGGRCSAPSTSRSGT
jgi:hypothetical protein